MCSTWLKGAAPASGAFAIDSPAGRHEVARDAAGGFVIDMGVPDFAPEALLRRGWSAPQPDYALEVDGIVLRFGAVSMGNPHAVLMVEDVERAPVAHLGPLLERHGRFPNRANVGFMQILAPDHIRLRVFERGTGETRACGSGACAAVVATMPASTGTPCRSNMSRAWYS